MMRKQLYLAEEQDKELKRRARALGLSEAELVRRAVDALLGLDASRPFAASDLAAVDELIRRADGLVQRGHRLPAGQRLVRESLYDEREERWGR